MSAPLPPVVEDCGVPMLTASTRRASGWACRAAPSVLGAALAKDCTSAPTCGSLLACWATVRTRPWTSR